MTGIVLLILTPNYAMPWPLAPWKEPRHPRIGWPPGPVWKGIEKKKNLSLTPAFETWTIQAIASHYNNYTTLAFIQCPLWPHCSYASYSAFESILVLPTIWLSNLSVAMLQL